MTGESPIPTASARALRPLAAGLSARGVSIDNVFAEAGVPQGAMQDPDARIPARLVHDLWRRAEELAGDAAFGLHTAGMIKPGSFDVLDFACRNCATVGEGLQLYCHFTPLLHDEIAASVSVGADVARLRHVLVDGSILPRQYAEFIIASLIVIVRQASERDIAPKAVHFLHPEPADASPHEKLFRAPVTFDADANGFELLRADFDRPLARAHPGLLEVLERHAEHLLEKSPRPTSFIAQVRAAIVAGLRSDTVGAGAVARVMGMSDRTLRRRLDGLGTSYNALLAEIRMGLATRYLEDSRLGTDDVAMLIGFSDRTAFIRAFRQWTGQTPSEYRRRTGPRA